MLWSCYFFISLFLIKEQANSFYAFCPTWNERRCGQGFVLKDYSDTTRIDNIVTSSKLKVINSKQEVLYKCPNGDHSVLILRKRKLYVKIGDILSSTQAEGIFHKITKAIYSSKTYTMHAWRIRITNYVFHISHFTLHINDYLFIEWDCRGVYNLHEDLV